MREKISAKLEELNIRTRIVAKSFSPLPIPVNSLPAFNILLRICELTAGPSWGIRELLMTLTSNFDGILLGEPSL